MERGTQIAYIPLYAHGNIKHKDVQFGFVTSQSKNCHFCRYWIKGKIGIELRTKSCSELTPNYYLVQMEITNQDNVDRELSFL